MVAQKQAKNLAFMLAAKGVNEPFGFEKGKNIPQNGNGMKGIYA